MPEPLACPYCSAILTDAQVRTLHKRYASAQRKTKGGGRNGGRPRVIPLAAEVLTKWKDAIASRTHELERKHGIE